MGESRFSAHRRDLGMSFALSCSTAAAREHNFIASCMGAKFPDELNWLGFVLLTCVLSLLHAQLAHTHTHSHAIVGRREQAQKGSCCLAPSIGRGNGSQNALLVDQCSLQSQYGQRHRWALERPVCV